MPIKCSMSIFRGRFIGRDVFGSMDGELQYMAYFIPGGNDSTGYAKIIRTKLIGHWGRTTGTFAMPKCACDNPEAKEKAYSFGPTSIENLSYTMEEYFEFDMLDNNSRYRCPVSEVVSVVIKGHEEGYAASYNAKINALNSKCTMSGYSDLNSCDKEYNTAAKEWNKWKASEEAHTIPEALGLPPVTKQMSDTMIVQQFRAGKRTKIGSATYGKDLK